MLSYHREKVVSQPSFQKSHYALDHSLSASDTTDGFLSGKVSSGSKHYPRFHRHSDASQLSYPWYSYTYSPDIPNGTIKALVFLASDTAPYLNGSKSTSYGVPIVLLRVPSGNIPKAPPLSNTFNASLLALVS